MPQASLDTKRRYYARIRQANYAASLKLEGIELKSDAPEAFEQDKQTLLAHYRRLSKSQ
ncbi:YhfG family protein [Pseudomonas oryzihabitans]|uniref:YhfG family protein n=1 Tax=Pseudomonas oryzihabitans TaxID=47885 RepID=UPI0016435328|nr:YhfG family protein [Pseudomonas psychrotolerans]